MPFEFCIWFGKLEIFLRWFCHFLNLSATTVDRHWRVEKIKNICTTSKIQLPQAGIFHQEIKPTKQHFCRQIFQNQSVPNASPKRYLMVGLMVVCLFCPTRQFNLNSLPWTCNLTVFYCLDLEYWQGILTINFSRKSNILCMHTHTKNRLQLVQSCQKKKGFYERFGPSTDVLLAILVPNLHFGACFAVWACAHTTRETWKF